MTPRAPRHAPSTVAGRPATLRARALGLFVEPRAPTGAEPGSAMPAEGGFLAPVAPPRVAARARAVTPLPVRAAVLGPAAEAVPLGALVANALRSSARAPAAALGVWAPGAGWAPRGGPATFAASRLAGRLSARALPAAARGRLAWMALDEHPVAATIAARRAAGAIEVPFVAVLAGPRCEVVEALLAEQDLVVVACAEPDGPLARLAVDGCVTAALACPAPPAGPARWLARTGTAGPRALPAALRALIRELGRPVGAADEPARESGPAEVAW